MAYLGPDSPYGWQQTPQEDRTERDSVTTGDDQRFHHPSVSRRGKVAVPRTYPNKELPSSSTAGPLSSVGSEPARGDILTNKWLKGGKGFARQETRGLFTLEFMYIYMMVLERLWSATLYLESALIKPCRSRLSYHNGCVEV